MCSGIKRQIVAERKKHTRGRSLNIEQPVSSYFQRKAGDMAHTDGEQLGGNTLELAQALGDGVGCSRRVSSMAIRIRMESSGMTPFITKSSDLEDAYRSEAPSTNRS